MSTTFELTASERARLAAVAAFAEREVAPQAAGWERDHRPPVQALRAAAAEGLLGLVVPRRLGGLELRPTAMVAVMETLAAADFFFAFALVVHNNLCGAIARLGSGPQQARYLPAMLRGERIGAFLLTEPGGGSDAAAITTLARPEGDGWVLSGEKAWISNAVHADVLSVYAQTEPALGWRGIGAWLVDAVTPGVIRQPAYSLLGGHALGTSGFVFDGVRLPPSSQFVAPGEGFKAAMAGIDLARVNVAGMCCGMLGDALDAAIRHSRARTAFGSSLAAKQGIEWTLADIATELAAARALTRDAAALLDRGEPAALAAAHAKKFATRAAFRGIAECMQIHGAAGLADDLPLGRQLTAAKTAQYLDGTTEIQNVVIGRALFRA